jgi:hypothetical protein
MLSGYPVAHIGFVPKSSFSRTMIDERPAAFVRQSPDRSTANFGRPVFDYKPKRAPAKPLAALAIFAKRPDFCFFVSVQKVED